MTRTARADEDEQTYWLRWRRGDVALQFIEHPDVVFERAPLTSVLCQVRYPPVLSLLTQAGLTGFQAGLRDEYPVLLEPERDASIAVTAEAVGIAAGPPVWRLTDGERTWTVGVSVDFVSLETASYSDFTEFRARFDRVLAVLRRTVRPADSVRIGLRKINQIDRGVFPDWPAVVRDELLGAAGVEGYPASLARGFGYLHFMEDDFTSMTVRHGVGLLGTQDVYVLDVDYATETPHEVNAGPDLSGLMQHFSDGMTSFFHWALKDAFLESLGPHARSGSDDS